MAALARGNGDHGALLDMSGTIANNATWNEPIYFTDNGTAIDISDRAWKMTFRANGNADSADFTLSTAAGTLAIEAGSSGTSNVLRITVAAGELDSYRGDYVADLAAQVTVGGAVTLWAHGIVTFRPNPVTF